MGALIPPGLTESPNYFGLMNNLVTLINCESLKEIDEIACVTPARSSRGQTLNCITSQSAHQNSITTSVKVENWRARFSLVKGYSKFLGNLRKSEPQHLFDIYIFFFIWFFTSCSSDRPHFLDSQHNSDRMLGGKLGNHKPVTSNLQTFQEFSPQPKYEIKWTYINFNFL